MSGDVTSEVSAALIGVFGTLATQRLAQRRQRAVPLRTMANKISEASDYNLHQNLEALSPLPNDRRAVAAKMRALITSPSQLGRFRQWEAFLGTYLGTERNKTVQSQVRELLSGVLDLERAFYSDYESVDLIHDEAVHATMKSFVGSVLTDDTTWSDEYIMSVKEKYVAFLRATVARIGDATGRLEGILA